MLSVHKVSQVEKNVSSSTSSDGSYPILHGVSEEYMHYYYYSPTGECWGYVQHYQLVVEN